jgi:hypothetical protein
VFGNDFGESWLYLEAGFECFFFITFITNFLTDFVPDGENHPVKSFLKIA